MYFLHSGFLSNFRLSWKQSALKFLHSGFLSNLRLPWKQSASWNFHCIEYSFYIQDFWANCACPETKRVSWKFSPYWIYFLHSGFLSNLRLPWKTACALKFLTVLNILFTFRIFEQLALALKNSVCPEISHCIKYTFYIQDFWATCACPENFHCIEYTFYIQDFWATCACTDILHCIEYTFYRLFHNCWNKAIGHKFRILNDTTMMITFIERWKDNIL